MTDDTISAAEAPDAPQTSSKARGDTSTPPRVTDASQLKLNQKQEAFAQAYIETGNASEAHRRAGYGLTMTAKTRNEAASRLLATNKVRTRVAELQAEHRERHDVTVDSLTQEYDDNRDLALQTAQPAAANGATTGKARLHGLDKVLPDTVNITQVNVTFSDLELARRLAFLIENGANAVES